MKGRIIEHNKRLYVVVKTLGSISDKSKRQSVSAAPVLPNGVIRWRNPILIESYRITNRKPVNCTVRKLTLK